MGVETLKFTYVPLKGDNTKLNCVDGWYEVILGAFNVLNKDNIYYTLGDIEKLIRDPRQLICQRLEAGFLTGEMGHPTPLPGMTGDQIIAHNLKMSEEKVSHVIREIEIVPINNKQTNNPFNKTIYIVKGWVKPHGPYASILKESLDDPYQNTAFSLRSIVSEEMVDGYLFRKVEIPITWDFVREPGISFANKNSTVSYNGKTIDLGKDLAVCHINVDSIKKYIQEAKSNRDIKVAGNESRDSYRRQVEFLYNRVCIDQPGLSNW